MVLGMWKRRAEEILSETKPLHVQVAEALGLPDVGWYYRESWENTRWVKGEPGTIGPTGGGGWYCIWDENEGGPRRSVPRYDTDWSSTGPLIERFGITLTHDSGAGPWIAEVPGVEWYPESTPLLAVCRCILELHASGKLSRVHATEEGKP